MKRYALLVGYDGTHLSGFQRQGKGERTVQGLLENAAKEVFGVPTRIVGSGRTDAGVHAMGQVCHLDAETAIPAEKLAVCLNAFLPPEIRVQISVEAGEGFDCTRGAKKKTYRYSLYTAACEMPVLERFSVYVKGELDVSRMKEAAELLLGEHDFRAFCAAGSSAKTSVRTLYAVNVEHRPFPLYTGYSIEVTGNGFLYNMVRILAGELVAIGQGKETASLQKALNGGSRSLLGKTMPAKGLTLMNVDYGVPLFGSRRED